MGKNVILTDSRLLKKVSKKLIKNLKKSKIDEEIIFDIHVSLEEALRNAMIHGNKSDIRKKIIIETEIINNRITLCIEDEGEGFNFSCLPNPTLDENLLKENGRGIYLMKHLMDKITFEKGGRRVVMVKFLDRKPL
ncbi:MAG: ATP-binding protein [Candidatus Omnitrophica bacterium]|nr:ATP-binding protein [Candidatus Omnitrophota bacterium]